MQFETLLREASSPRYVINLNFERSRRRPAPIARPRTTPHLVAASRAMRLVGIWVGNAVVIGLVIASLLGSTAMIVLAFGVQVRL